MEDNRSHRMLWLTDTFNDHNGVSTVLQTMHREIIARNLPIDILVCSNTIREEEHLIVLRPVSEFTLPLYRQQPFRIPGFFALQRIFKSGKYDRVLCSTEGPMGLAALYLKKRFAVKTFFYLHTDWLMFARQAMDLEKTGLANLQILLRFFYRRFDHIFVLNTDQQKWLTGHEMQFEPSRVFITAHWADEIFSGSKSNNQQLFNLPGPGPVLLFTGRISREKGVFELPAIFRKAKESIPELQMVIAGTGPAEEELKSRFPEAIYTGWVDHSGLPSVYAACDLLLLPSKFDTFSCVVIESLSCGLPVIAYNTKGPKDILQDSVNGFLVETAEEMSERIVDFFSSSDLRLTFRNAALDRAKHYSAGRILEQFVRDAGLAQNEYPI